MKEDYALLTAYQSLGHALCGVGQVIQSSSLLSCIMNHKELFNHLDSHSLSIKSATRDHIADIDLN